MNITSALEEVINEFHLARIANQSNPMVSALRLVRQRHKFNDKEYSELKRGASALGQEGNRRKWRRKVAMMQISSRGQDFKKQKAKTRPAVQGVFGDITADAERQRGSLIRMDWELGLRRKTRRRKKVA